MKRLFIGIVIIGYLSLIISAQTTTSASYGQVHTSLTTTGTGAVNGTTYALPPNANVITWQVVADGSASSTVLQGSLNNTTWATLDSNAVATGGIQTVTFNAVRFIRINQVSRTGGTSTSGMFSVAR